MIPQILHVGPCPAGLGLGHLEVVVADPDVDHEYEQDATGGMCGASVCVDETTGEVIAS